VGKRALISPSVLQLFILGFRGNDGRMSILSSLSEPQTSYVIEALRRSTDEAPARGHQWNVPGGVFEQLPGINEPEYRIKSAELRLN
jgi:hypothetical protein